MLKSNKNELQDLTASLNQTNKIIINPRDKLFELRFSLMDFIDNEQNKYAYQIEEYDENWHYIQENFIRITNLPYGNYTLKIKGQGNKGQ